MGENGSNYEWTFPSGTPIHSIDFRDGIFFVNGVGYHPVEWLYPIGKRKNTDLPKVILENSKTKEFLQLSIALVEEQYGLKIPLPIGEIWPGKE